MTSSNKGAFISVDGADGAGKSTQLAFIADWLRARGVEVRCTHEPGGTALGGKLREIVLGDADIAIDARSALLLMFAAREQHLAQVVRPALAAGVWVVCDRFIDSTYAYQGGGQGVEMSDIAVLEKWVQGDLQPDLSVVLDVAVEVGEARMDKRGERLDNFERQHDDFKRAVREVFLQRAVQFPTRIKLVDANRAVDAVRGEIEAILQNFWGAFVGNVADNRAGNENGA